MPLAKINEQGRLVIPAEARNQSGLKPGDTVQVQVVGPGELRVVSAAHTLREARALVARHVPKGRDIVKEFLRDRVKDSGE